MSHLNRRGFLKALSSGLAATAALAAVDPEFLLWRPGAKSIFLPPERQVIGYTIQIRVPQRFRIRAGMPLQPQPILNDVRLFATQREADAFTAQWEIDNGHPGFFGPSAADIHRAQMRSKYPEYFQA